MTFYKMGIERSIPIFYWKEELFMEPDVIVSMVGSLGFPIVMCIFLLYMQNTTLKEMTETNKLLQMAIEKLISKLGGTE